ncbi:MAG: MarR family transcriptional regulator [Sphingomonadales bacterium]|nr:MarR family transcriptional regulator [Sphingomonadales bacterium]
MEENFGTLLAQVARLMRRSFDERARGIGVTRPQWQVLSLLTRHEGINQGGLADILEVEPITLGRMIDRLQEADLVERRPDPADRRAWRLFITDRGNALFDQLRPCAEETIEIAIDGLDAGQRAALTAMLMRIRANLTRRGVGSDGLRPVGHG